MNKKRKSNAQDIESSADESDSNDGGNFGDIINSDDNEDADESETFKAAVPILGKKMKKKSGGFQSMGLSYPVLKGILKKGYNVPTPIQRKTIPVIIEGKDVVAMARTGSGKTGAFLIPMLQKLKTRIQKVGARALIFSPTRELALQTYKFTKELGKYTGLKSLLVLGGEKIEDQFSAIHENPDIIIATPGRFLHLMIEMDLKLSSIEYMVFDEADRLFEMGFQEQIQEVINRLPEHRQTLMFSATLPRILVDFVRAGLSDPVLLRLDVELKLSENLKNNYLCCRSLDKPAILLHLLKNKLNLSEELTVVFLATRHHVEYIKDVLSKASIDCSYIYSSLDQTARKIHVDKFRAKKVGVLLVTDIAARGIDIPLLDNVINYNFPAKPKLFVHRVGRVARAGRRGTAYSLVSPDEIPYLLDLHLFIGKHIKFSEEKVTEQDGICGSVPQSLIDDENDALRRYHESSVDLENMVKVCSNAYKHYIKSRPAPSSESIKRTKNYPQLCDKIHPIFFSGKDSVELERSKFLNDMKSYRPNTTIFEIGATAKTQASAVMREKRIHHSIIDKIRSMKSEGLIPEDKPVESKPSTSTSMVAASEDDIKGVFTSIEIRDSSEPKRLKKKDQKDFKDHDHYLSYQSKEHYSDKGFGLQNSFAQDASGAVLDMMGDDMEGSSKMKAACHWDRKKKKFMQNDDSKKKKMKTESGVWISKSYKTDIYKKWSESHKISHQEDQSDGEDENQKGRKNNFKNFWKGKKGKDKMEKGNSDSRRPMKREMKNKEEILKTRKRKAKLMAHQKRRQAQKGHKKGNVKKHHKKR